MLKSSAYDTLVRQLQLSLDLVPRTTSVLVEDFNPPSGGHASSTERFGILRVEKLALLHEIGIAAQSWLPRQRRALRLLLAGQTLSHVAYQELDELIDEILVRLEVNDNRSSFEVDTGTH